MTGLDARLRRTFAGIDTSPGFEARLLARIATAARAAVPASELRARAERRRDETRRRLRREAWAGAAIAAAAGAAALMLVWSHAPAVARWSESVMAAAADPRGLMDFAIVVLAACLWPVMSRFASR